MKARASGKKKRKNGLGKLAAQLAPLEEQDRGAVHKPAGSHQSKATSETQPPGPLMDSRGLPKGVVDDDESDGFRIDPQVLLILGLILAYIAFIAWQISEAASVTSVGGGR